MLPTETNERDFRQDFAYAIALCLSVATVLLIVSAILRAATYSGTSVREHIELISQGAANVITAGLMLATVAALVPLAPERSPRTRPILIGTLIVSGLIVLLTVFSVVDVVTIHIPGPNSQESVSVVLSRGGFKDRLATLLPEVAAMLIALVAMVGANRLGNLVSGSRGSADFPPG
jgi:hypothetical protein